MKQNLKVNLVWLGLLIAGFALIQVLVAAGVLNLFYVQILEQIGINIILAVGLTSSLVFQVNSHSVMPDLWPLVHTLQLFSVLNRQPTELSLALWF